MSSVLHRIPVLLIVALVLGGCGILYKQPIYQGNLIKKESVEQLRVGLTKQQVAELMGTPSVRDPFHAQRWDYASTQRMDRRGTTQTRNLTLYFENDILARWEGDYFPDNDAALVKSSARQFGRNLPKDRRRGR